MRNNVLGVIDASSHTSSMTGTRGERQTPLPAPATRRTGGAIAGIREECDAHPLVDVVFRTATLRTEVRFEQAAQTLDPDAVDSDILRYLGGRTRPARALVELLGVSRQAVNKRVRRLETLSLIEREGRGRATRYRLRWVRSCPL